MSLWTRTLALPLTACLAAAGLSASARPAAAADPCQQLDRPLVRVLHTASQNSLTTASTTEADKAAAHGFGTLTTMGRGATAAQPGLVAVHRLWKVLPDGRGDFVTAPEADLATWQQRGYADQGVRYHAAPASASCGVAVHRLVRQGIHQEVLAGDVAAMTAQGWADAGAKFRLAAQGAADPSPQVVLPPASDGPDADGRFSLAVIPDTQNETLVTGAPRLAARNRWLVGQRGPLDLRAALHVGDMVNWDTAGHEQYANAATGMKVLEEAGLPWVGAIGNHDAMATDVGGSARQGVDVHTALRDTGTYNSVFHASHFPLRTATEAGRQDNSVHDFTAGGLRWSVVVLELWPRQDKLDWAIAQVRARADRNVIVLTHNYVAGNGEVQGWNGGYGDLAPTAIRDQLVAPHPNVKIVLSGHEGVDQWRTDDHPGHRVVSLLQNYDNDTDALVRLLEVDANANTLTHRYRSTTTDREVSPATTVEAMSWIR